MPTSPPNITNVHLCKLTPDDVETYWDTFIESSIRSNLTEMDADDEDSLRRVYTRLRECAVHAYTVCGKADGEDAVLGLLILGKGQELLTLKRTLFIWSLDAYQHLTTDNWREAFEALRIVGKSLGCDIVQVETGNSNVVEIINLLGGRRRASIMELSLCQSLV